MSENTQRDIDLLDLLSGASGAILIASFVGSGGTLAIGLPVIAALWGQHSFRRTKIFESWIDHITHPKANEIVRNLALPAPKENMSMVVHQDKPLDVNIVNNDRSLFARMTNPTINTSGGESVLTGVLERNTIAKQQQATYNAIKRLPKYLSYKQLPESPSRLAVPVGYEANTKQVLWADFGNTLDTKILHALVAGYTGSGKDALLRLWFATLTTHNTPEEIQFVVIDGKVDWLSPALKESAYMAIPPSGGSDLQKVNGKWVDCALDLMKESFEWIFDEINKRQQAFAKVGAVDMASYTRKTGIKLPMLFVLASDVGEMFDKDLKMLVNQLIMKGRAFGVRLIISLQNPVGEATKWRSQIGLIMTGHQENPDHDRYVLGINVNTMQYRPSLLPNPEETDIARGLFIVRRGSAQQLVRTFHLPEEDWETYIESIMETRTDHIYKKNTPLLEDLLFNNYTAPETPKVVVKHDAITKPNKVLLTTTQVNDIIGMVQMGVNKTTIMVDYLKATNPERYKELSPAVDTLIRAVKAKMQ